MKRLFFILLMCLCAAGIHAQNKSNRTQPMDFYIVRGSVPPVLNIVPNTYQFIDGDNNGVIDANEQCKIRFQVANTGRGDGYGCVAHVQASGHTAGLQIKDVSLPVIPHGATIWVEIPIVATEQTMTGQVSLSIVINEPNGFGTETLQANIGTHQLKVPDIQVASYKVVGESGGTLERRKPFGLQIVVQNLDQGTAEQVQIHISLPRNVSRIGGDMATVTLPAMTAGESRTLEYELIANQEASEQIDLQIKREEKQKKYAKDATIPLQFGQYIGGSIAMNVARKDEEVAITKASLISDVDENIPVTKNKNPNTFVLIIANEHYQQVASVPFALNDGNIFREYCIKTLGVSEKHIKYLTDATGNQIKAAVNWLNTVVETFDEPQIIVYYAGHGFPDESSKTAYLLPVDGAGTDITTGYKLDELYATLGSMPASQITVFMDACFSGSKREQGMLASARGVALKAKTGAPRGNMVVFSAAQGDETAYPNREQQHGLFTYYLLKKLQETEGNINLKALGDYITKNVSQQSIIVNDKKQTPCVTPSASIGTDWQNWKLK